LLLLWLVLHFADALSGVLVSTKQPTRAMIKDKRYGKRPVVVRMRGIPANYVNCSPEFDSPHG
jgi:hypothetical protein